MISKNKANFFLILSVFFAIIFYSYFINKNKGAKLIKIRENQNSESSLNFSEGMTKFENVEYSTEDNDKKYITRAKEAFLSNKNLNLIYLNKVNSFTTLNDGTTLNVQSEKADYYKNSKNIKYYQNVVISNKNATIKTDIAYFISKKNLIRLEENVIFNDTINTIKADIAELNTINNDLNIYMKEKADKVYGTREKKN
jgi:hypothetical protein